MPDWRDPLIQRLDKERREAREQGGCDVCIHQRSAGRLPCLMHMMPGERGFCPLWEERDDA